MATAARGWARHGIHYPGEEEAHVGRTLHLQLTRKDEGRIRFPRYQGGIQGADLDRLGSHDPPPRTPRWSGGEPDWLALTWGMGGGFGERGDRPSSSPG